MRVCKTAVRYANLVNSIVDEEFARWRQERASTTHFDQARDVFTAVACAAGFKIGATPQLARYSRTRARLILRRVLIRQ